MDGWMGGCMDGDGFMIMMDGWMGWFNGLKDGSMDGWMD